MPPTRRKSLKNLALILLTSHNLSRIQSFNIDTQDPWRIQRNQSTVDFGHSIALSESGNIFIGTPNSDNGRGSLYRCDFKNKNCHEILINTKKPGDEFYPFRLGGAVDISPAGKVAVSAPGTYQEYHYMKQMNNLQSSSPSSPKPHLVKQENRINTGMVYTFDEYLIKGCTNFKQCLVNNDGLNTIRPCNKEDLGHSCKDKADGCDKSHCVAGTSLKFLDDESTMVSLPGAYFSQGTVERYKLNNPQSHVYQKTDVNNRFEYRFLKKDKLLENSTNSAKTRKNMEKVRDSNYRKILLDSNLPKFYRDAENSTKSVNDRNAYQNTYDSNLIGLSLAIVYSDEAKSRNYMAIGAPARYQFNQLGSVIIREVEMKDNVDDIVQFNGDIIGERFGYSIISHDFNGDSKSDLLVGAPMHTDKECKMDCGKVYYFQQIQPDKNGNPQWEKRQVIDPPEELPNGRFGHSMGFLGDIDTLPGDEVLVGMPTAGDNIGAVAILSYQEDKEEEDEEGNVKGPFVISQVIKGSEIYPSGNSESKYFGLSVMERRQNSNMRSRTTPKEINIDDKNQGDIIVGSKNEVAVLFSKKVITMNPGFPKITFQKEKIDLKPENFNCKKAQSENGKNNAICYDITFEIDLGNQLAKSSQDSTFVNMNITLDSLLESKGSRRLKFDANENKLTKGVKILTDSEATVVFYANVVKIKTYIIPKDVEDLTTDVKIQTDTFLTSSGESSFDLNFKRKKRAVGREMMPVLNPDSAHKSSLIKLAKNCGVDDICQARIKMDAVIEYKEDMNWFLVVPGDR